MWDFTYTPTNSAPRSHVCSASDAIASWSYFLFGGIVAQREVEDIAADIADRRKT
jgi:hypothetical protein